MKAPLSNKPKITTTDIEKGFVSRYFVEFISDPKVVEVDKKQYDEFKKNAFYQTLELPWLISGYANNITAVDGKPVYGARHKNQVTVNFYSRQMPELSRLLYNPLEYFQGVDNRST